MKYVAFIFAKGNSEGLKNKNILDLNGMPLIAHTIIQAQKCEVFDDIVVSTDSEKIADIAVKYGASVPFMRPSVLSEANTPELDCWKHAIKEYRKYKSNFEYFVSLPCTSPLRRPYDILKLLNSHQDDHDITLCITPSSRSPYFNMVKKNEDGTINLIIKSKYNNRQEIPLTYDVTTIGYISKTDYVLKCSHIFNGNVGAITIDKQYCLDIDDSYDFEIASSLMKTREEYK